MCKSWKCPASGILVFLSLTLMTAGFVLTLAGWVAPANKKAVDRVRTIAPLMMTSGTILLLISCCVCAFNQNRCCDCCYKKITSKCNAAEDDISCNEPEGKEIIPNCYIQESPCDISRYIDMKADAKQSLIKNTYPTDTNDYYVHNEVNNMKNKPIQNPTTFSEIHIDRSDSKNTELNSSSLTETNHIKMQHLPDMPKTRTVPNNVFFEKTSTNNSNISENNISQEDPKITLNKEINCKIKHPALNRIDINNDTSILVNKTLKTPLPNGSIKDMIRPSSDSFLACSSSSPTDDKMIEHNLKASPHISKSVSSFDNNQRDETSVKTLLGNNDDGHKSQLQQSFAQTHHSIRQVSFPPSACLHHCLSPKSVHRKLLNEKRYHIVEHTKLPPNYVNIEHRPLLSPKLGNDARYISDLSHPMNEAPRHMHNYKIKDSPYVARKSNDDELSDQDITFVTSCL